MTPKNDDVMYEQAAFLFPNVFAVHAVQPLLIEVHVMFINVIAKVWAVNTVNQRNAILSHWESILNHMEY